jgi:hypothetical protein
MNDEPVDTHEEIGIAASHDANTAVNGCRAVSIDTEQALIDWDVKIDVPPPRPTEIVALHFVNGGKRPIRIMDDPQD